jgi:transcriptional regulator with XRE-family HTH domain
MESRDRHAGREILARNLRRLRRAKGLTQEELADKVGLSQTYLSEVEGEKRNISLDNIEALATAFGISISDLLKKGD